MVATPKSCILMGFSITKQSIWIPQLKIMKLGIDRLRGWMSYQSNPSSHRITVGQRLFKAHKILSLRYGRFGSTPVESWKGSRSSPSSLEIVKSNLLSIYLAKLQTCTAKLQKICLDTAASPYSMRNEFLMTPNRAMTRSATSFKTHRKRYSRGAQGRLDPENAEQGKQL